MFYHKEGEDLRVCILDTCIEIVDAHEDIMKVNMNEHGVYEPIPGTLSLRIMLCVRIL